MPSVARTLALDHPPNSSSTGATPCDTPARFRPAPSVIGIGRLPCRFAPCPRTRNGLAHTLDAISHALFRIHLPTQGRNRKRNYKLLGPFHSLADVRRHRF